MEYYKYALVQKEYDFFYDDVEDKVVRRMVDVHVVYKYYTEEDAYHDKNDVRLLEDTNTIENVIVPIKYDNTEDVGYIRLGS